MTSHSAVEKLFQLDSHYPWRSPAVPASLFARDPVARSRWDDEQRKRGQREDRIRNSAQSPGISRVARVMRE